MGRIEGNREFLTNTELKRLEAIYSFVALKKQERNILKYFLFACLTGLRFRDISNLRFKDIENDMISIIMHKTKEPVVIPVNDRTNKLLQFDKESSMLPNERIFKTYTNQATNRILKEIMPDVGITKSISFHCARHTFATIAITLGIPLDVNK